VETGTDYVAKALHLASDLEELQALRKRLRGMMDNSALTGAKQFALAMETCYQEIWRNWCRQ